MHLEKRKFSTQLSPYCGKLRKICIEFPFQDYPQEEAARNILQSSSSTTMKMKE